MTWWLCWQFLNVLRAQTTVTRKYEFINTNQFSLGFSLFQNEFLTRPKMGLIYLCSIHTYVWLVYASLTSYWTELGCFVPFLRYQIQLFRQRSPAFLSQRYQTIARLTRYSKCPSITGVWTFQIETVYNRLIVACYEALPLKIYDPANIGEFVLLDNNPMFSQCGYDFCWMCHGPWKEHGAQYYECSKFKVKFQFTIFISKQNNFRKKVQVKLIQMPVCHWLNTCTTFNVGIIIAEV